MANGAAAEASGGGRDWAGTVMPTVVGRELPATGKKILLAAQRVLARDGSEALTVRRIADEAFETKSLVLYHFGCKANLEALLVDSLWHDTDAGFVRSLDRMAPDTPTRVAALIDFYAGIAADERLWQMYYGLVPSVVGDVRVRRNLARVYESYRRDINARCLRETDLGAGEVEGLSSLYLAVGEGLPLQELMDPAGFGMAGAFALLGDLTLRAPASQGDEPERSSREPASRDVRWAPRGDPAQGAAKPAQKILRAARRLLERRGLRAVTLDAIAKASGQPRSSVSYYYQSKQGLIEALLAAILHRHQLAFGELFSDGPPEPAELHGRLFAPDSPLRAFFLMLPAVLHDPGLRESAGTYYAELRQWLAGRLMRAQSGGAGATSLASLSVACLDGVAIQALYDPAGFDPLPALRSTVRLIAAGSRG